MKRLIRRLSLTEVVPLSFALSVFILSVASSKSDVLGLRGQEKSILGEPVRNPKDDPVTVVDIKVGTKTVVRDEQFDAADDWLKDLSFKVQNRSSKTVTYIA